MIRKVLLSVILIITFGSCKVGRFFWYNFSDITDYKIFPKRDLPASAIPFHFINAQQNKILEKQIKVSDHEKKVTTLEEFLEKTPTVAFLIIRNDSLLYEKYLHDFDTASLANSFSVSKSFVSALIGIAIDEGKIKSEDDSVVTYVTELRNKSGWNKVTIHHLLQMASGVKSGEGYYTPFSGAASLYYGRTLRKTLARLKTERSPLQGFDYKSVNTQLLGLIIERATGKQLTTYLNEKIWQPIGMEFEGSWSIDKKKNGLEKAFCCINARARDFAKFGRLYLNKGEWNGQRVVPREWVEKSTEANREKGSAEFYNRQWWIGPKEGDFTAIGHLGQYIYVLPGKNLIIVRLGTSRAREEWMNVLRQVADQM